MIVSCVQGEALSVAFEALALVWEVLKKRGGEVDTAPFACTYETNDWNQNHHHNQAIFWRFRTMLARCLESRNECFAMSQWWVRGILILLNILSVMPPFSNALVATFKPGNCRVCFDRSIKRAGKGSSRLSTDIEQVS